MLSYMQHISERVVETLFRTGAIVPGRFQDGFANEAEHSSRLKAWLSEAESCGDTAEMGGCLDWICLEMIPWIHLDTISLYIAIVISCYISIYIYISCIISNIIL